MRRLLCIGLLAAVAAGAGAQGPVSAADENDPRSPWSFNFRAEAEVRYDDNVLGLSDTEIRSMRRLEEPENDERFRIETPNDVIFNPLVGFGVYRKPPRGLDTAFGASIGTNQYLRNTVKDYHEYRLWVRQQLNHSRAHRTTLGVGGTRIPSYFLRQLVDDDISAPPNTCNTSDPNDLCHEAATFQLTTGYLELTQEVVDKYLSAELRYARERRDYNHEFDERDADSDVWSIQVNIHPTGGIGFRLRPYYEHERRTTRGDPGTSSTITEDDAGFDGDMIGLEARGLWGADADHRNTLRGYYQRERRDFTSDDPNDTGHFGREDRITKFGIGYGRELGPHFRLNVSAYHRDNDVSTSSSTFARNVVAFSIGYESAR